MYIINELTNDIYDDRYLSSLNNVLPNAYYQQYFRTISKIFEFKGSEDFQVIKTALNYTDDRLIVLLGHKRNIDLNILRVYQIIEPYDVIKLNLIFK